VAEPLFPLITVCCFWGWCGHVETGFAPAAVHDQMEHHYRTEHQADIAALVGPIRVTVIPGAYWEMP
jgi:hypothetical protein